LKNFKVKSIIQFKKPVKEMRVVQGRLYIVNSDGETFLIKIGEDLPGYLPKKLFINDRMVLIYEEG
jgi:hypothetical protein